MTYQLFTSNSRSLRSPHPDLCTNAPSSPSERSLSGCSAADARRRSPFVEHQRRSQDLARTAGGRLHAANQSASGYSRRALVTIHAADRGGSILPRTQKRTLHPSSVPSTGAARQGSCDGCLSWLRTVGHAQAFAEAAACHSSAALENGRQ